MAQKSTVVINSKFFKKVTDDELKPLLEKVGQDMKTKINMSFRKEQDPDGKKWRPLSQSTLRARRKGRKGKKSPKILRSSGDLNNSINVRVIGRSVQAGTNLIYAPTQNFGDRRRNIPARKFVGITEVNRKKYSRQICKGVREIIEKRGQGVL